MRIFQVLDLPRAFLEVRRVFHQLNRFVGVAAPLYYILNIEYHALDCLVDSSSGGSELRELSDGNASQYREDTEIQICAEISQGGHGHIEDIQRVKFLFLVNVVAYRALYLLRRFRDERSRRAVQPDILCEADILLLVVYVVIHAVDL